MGSKKEGEKRETYNSHIYKWFHYVREQSRNIWLPNLRLVSRYFKTHANLYIAKLPTEFVLFRILAKPYVKTGLWIYVELKKIL